MNETLETIVEQLEKVKAQLDSSIGTEDSFGVSQANWSFPGLSKSELIEEVQLLVDAISENGDVESLGDLEERLEDYARRLKFLQAQTIPNLLGSANAGVSAFMFTLGGLRRALGPLIEPKDNSAEAMAELKRLVTRLRGLESRITDVEPRTAELATMVKRIEDAYHAADQLPADLQSLSEDRKKIAALVVDATKDQVHIGDIRRKADETDESLSVSSEQAASVLERCETAYSAATSVGLAAAFNERSESLAWSMWAWVAGLIIALVVGGFFGSEQLRSLTELIKAPDSSPWLVALNLVLSLLSVGAPVWFAWLATKQIGHRFRLAEDYAFKASISRAYEGFRRETARFDKDMEARLLSSALTRLDELPLRLVPNDNHGSPWHELANSDIVRQALNAIPGFAEQVKDLASKAIDATQSKKSKLQPVSSLKPAVVEEAEGA